MKLLPVKLFPVFAGLLIAFPLAAQVPATPVAVLPCDALRHHGNPGARACYQGLTRATDPAVQAEGFWGIGDFRAANDAFRAATKHRERVACWELELFPQCSRYRC